MLSQSRIAFYSILLICQMLHYSQMRSVSLELEILGRHQHSELTIPFLKVHLSVREYSSSCCWFILFLFSP